MSNKENIIEVLKDPKIDNVVKSSTNEIKGVLKETTANKHTISHGLSEVKAQNDQKTKSPIKHMKEVEKIETTVIEKVRKNPTPKKEKDEKPLFIREEKDSHVNIHHKEQQKKELPTAVILEDAVKEQNETAPDPQSELLKKQLTTKLSTLTRERDTKIKLLSELRQQLSDKRKQLTTYDEKLKEIDRVKSNIAVLKEKCKEQEDYYKELCDMMAELNESGLVFQQKYNQQEEEINALLNKLSETKYKIP